MMGLMLKLHHETVHNSLGFAEIFSASHTQQNLHYIFRSRYIMFTLQLYSILSKMLLVKVTDHLPY